LFQLDLERIEEQYMAMIHRVPSCEESGLKDDFNGPICYTPDGNPLVGPAPGLRNMWLAEGFSFGITAAGGTGYYLAQMMVEGEAEIDMASLDPKRYGDWMTTEFAARKNEECYDHVYILHHPDEERPACRPLRTSPSYDRQAARGAQFGFVNGWERPNYFGPLDAPDNFDHDARSFRRGGWILGVYEKDAPARFEHGVPDSFRADLFQLNLERIEDQYMAMIHRMPSCENSGLKDDFNGPICYTPDGNPLVGPAPGLCNMWLAEGFSFGITAAGGTGYYLAQMMVEGEAEIDMASLDPKRYGDWMTTEFATRKNEECYDHVYVLHHPDEERPTARPLRTAPAYDRQKALGAQFGFVNGWERPNYYGPLDAADNFDEKGRSFRRGTWWPHAVEEAKAIREGVGLVDATAFTKHVVKGPGATQFLDWFTCNKLPKIGRINLTYALTDHGTTRTEYTIVRNGENSYYLVSAGAWTDYDADFLRKAAEDNAEEFGYIEIHNGTTQWGVFALAGPKSRDLMKKVINDADPETALSNKRFPWLSAKQIELDMCPVNAIRVAYTGELGWELHHPMEMQNYLWDLLLNAGEEFGLKLVGARAQNWLRQEKSYRAFGNELGRDATPAEADLPRFIDLSKDFNGKEAMEAKGIRSKCVTVLIDGPEDADPWGREAVLLHGKKVGRLTSGGYSVHFGKQIGMGYVEPALANVGQKLQVRMLNELWNAEVVEDSPYDPTNANIRVNG
jgi:dimethylglycine dehydrogenase